METFRYPKRYEVIVIGAGHAGVEAAAAAARIGCETLLLTQNADTIGQMSCNPAIGGLGKGHMVREIDALGGLMAENTDATAIQFRMLNRRKGPSVQAPRAQCDKKAYQFRLKAILESGYPHLDVKQAPVRELLFDGERLCGVATDLGVDFLGDAVVVTTGTFLRALMHVGTKNLKGGRMGDGVSNFSDHLKALGFEIGRFKTGTPCRLLASSIDFSRLERQEGDAPPRRFSFLPPTPRSPADLFSLNDWADQMFHVEQSPCWITHTNNETHRIIRENLHLSPMYSGRIEGIGPRYCPSIEDKVVRFAEKPAHQLFLEPEGRHTSEIYVNGISTSLPYEIQYRFIRSVAGLEKAEILRPGYAVEYDYCPPTQLAPTLETRRIENLYFAGQINGTSGYEEAAAQGLIAGANAALKLRAQPPLILSRSQAYIGVMIDDLVTRGTPEPYRMFTSRAEYRLLLRHDNADLRLTPLAVNAGLATPSRQAAFSTALSAREGLQRFVQKARHEDIPLSLWLKRPDNHFTALPDILRRQAPDSVWETLEIDLKYEGYISRQEAQVRRFEKHESAPIPQNFDFCALPGLRNEAAENLSRFRPHTLGQAARIQGVTPADLGLLAVWIQKSSAVPIPIDTGDCLAE